MKALPAACCNDGDQKLQHPSSRSETTFRLKEGRIWGLYESSDGSSSTITNPRNLGETIPVPAQAHLHIIDTDVQKEKLATEVPSLKN